MKLVVKRRGYKLFVILFSLFVLAFFALPLLWLFTAPFDAKATLRVSLPSMFTINNFRSIFANTFAIRALFVNSVIIAGGTMVGVALFATIAAYAVSRLQLRGRDALAYALVLFSSVVQGTAAMVPIFLLLYYLRLVDTHSGVIFVLIGGLLPTGIFLMRDFVESIPRSYEESALVSGAQPLQVLRQVVIPVLRPGIMVLAVWAFVQAWGDFLISLIVIRSPTKMPAPIAIYSFYTEGGTPVLTLVSAYSLIYAFPVIGLYLFVNWRYGFRFFGGIKGGGR